MPPPRRRWGAQIRMHSVKLSMGDVISNRDLIRLAMSSIERVVRVTGGASKSDPLLSANVADRLAQALGGSRCSASVIAGATMTINRPKPGFCKRCDRCRTYCREHSFNVVRHPGVMDVLPRLFELGAPGKTIGIVPTIDDPVLQGGFLVVEDDPEEEYYVAVDEATPICLLMQFDANEPKLTWDHEWKAALEYIKLLRREGYGSLHLVDNGGMYTRNEIEYVAQLRDPDNPWYILLIEDTGEDRTAYKLANDRDFRRGKPQIVSCTQAELNTVVRQMGFAPEPVGVSS